MVRGIDDPSIDTGCLQKFELMYNDQNRRGHVAEKTQFDYAWCLIRSRYIEDMKRGVSLLDGESACRENGFFLEGGWVGRLGIGGLQTFLKKNSPVVCNL